MLNNISLAGRLTRNPELRRTQSGVSVTSFTLAVDRDYSSKDSGERGVDFIECVAWRNTAEFVSKYFTKGQMAIVQGRLEIRSYTDKDGNNRKAAEVNVSSAYFGGRKDAGTQSTESSEPPQQNGPEFAELPDDDGDLPF